ncbi:MAG: ribbon-helix-helix domain-containing protein [Armatimonadota bacterium]|nr:ribbon-helix-helix domain-containing protein [Armatimonadota bacterium]
MPRSSRITISLPTPLLEALDHKLARAGESRGAVVRRLIEQALREAQEREDVERSICGDHEHPQTEEELGWLDQVVPEALAEQAWD